MALKTVSACPDALCRAGNADGKLSIYHWFEYIPDELLQI